MIIGIGTDIIEISRIGEFVEKGDRYIERIFTPAEIGIAQRRGASCIQFFAGRFAAKEAVAKCIGPPLKWHDVEILEDASGKPVVKLGGIAEELAGGGKILVTISHNHEHAVAFAVLEDS